ncbi:C4-type zinc ribbon domain-containing protein [bacterium]|jgi:predicted  nucleic acid-binding Zn-ribbon protein|nr:C4-type zinc ribbon domain-containing protein [bacterium]
MPTEARIEIRPTLLRKLHRIHRQLNDLQGQLDRCPRQIQAGEHLVQQASAEKEQLQASLKTATMACDDKQLQLQSREAKIAELEGKLNSAASNREFTLLKEQIAADLQANEVLSDEILEALENIDQLQSSIREATEKENTQQSEQADRITEVEKREAELRSEVERIQDELQSSEKEIPASAIEDYRRITEARGEEALAPVDDESCGGCYQTLTTQLIDRLRMSLLIRCPNCNAFLYAPEDRQVR